MRAAAVPVETESSKAFWERLGRGLAAQALVFLPDAINVIAPELVPTIPAPWGVMVGLTLNAIGSALRRKDADWKWVPI
jgi:hypothetical protein